jgi:hypothetical protein
LFRGGRKKPDHPALQYRALIAAVPQDPAQVVPLGVGATIPTGPSAPPMAPTGVGFQPDPQRHTDGYYTNEVANEPQRQVDENCPFSGSIRT